MLAGGSVLDGDAGVDLVSDGLLLQTGAGGGVGVSSDALEMTVIEAPVAGATSLSGIQPKLGLVEQGGRYVARTRDSRSSVHIIDNN